ncbi:MAG: D-alanine--D-alanine ligase, partial [Lachnospira sp.]|nr:D-alanine--D-alanine ligase [Lachnospira sp.]
MNIAVIAGGTSTERDVSLSSGKLICASLRRNGHNANMIDVFLGSDKYDNVQDFFNDKNDLEELASELGKMSPKIKEIETERKEKSEGFFGPMVLDVCKAADIVYIGLHGSNGEDGKIQAAFDLFGIKYTGTDYLSSAISMDKHLTKKMLATEGVPV